MIILNSYNFSQLKEVLCVFDITIVTILNQLLSSNLYIYLIIFTGEDCFAFSRQIVEHFESAHVINCHQ